MVMAIILYADDEEALKEAKVPRQFALVLDDWLAVRDDLSFTVNGKIGMSDLFVALFAAATAHHSPVADQLPQADPATYYRSLTQVEETTTSRCIGKNDDPVCVLETLLACSVRADNTLCKEALAEGVPPVDFRPQAGKPARYRIDGASMQGNAAKYFPGVLVGDVILKVSAIEPMTPARSYYVGKRGNQWKVFGWEPAKTASK